MEKRKKIIVVLVVVAVVVGSLSLIFGCEESGVVAAFAGLVGVPATAYGSDVNAPELNREDISTSVTQMLPSRTPVDTIMRNLKRSQKAMSQKIGYYQASYKPICDALDVAATGAGTSAAAPASAFSTNPTTEASFIYIKVLNADMWRNNDTLLMRGLTLPGSKGAAVNGGTGTHTEDVMFYVAEKNDTVLKLIPIGGLKGALSGKFVIPNFENTTVLVRMGQAKSELDITTDPFAIYPTLSWQYCQNFMAQIEESTFQKLTQKEASWGFSNFEAVNIMSMKMEMELSMLFGSEGEYVAGNSRTYFTRGITRDIENTLTYGKGSGDLTITKENYNTWLKEVFDGNNGSTNRVLFAGSGLIKSLCLVDEFTRSITSVEKDAVLGVDVRKINTYFGTLDVVLAPLFREAGWENNGLILDLEHVTKHEFVPMSVTNLDLKSSGTRNADARVIQEVSCLTLRHPDCHAIIKPQA
ncbi:MAG: DUF5309 family protein [Rikenellaceae bacterium]